MTSRHGAAAGRVVFWVIALAVIGGLGYYVYTKKTESVGAPTAPSLAAMGNSLAAAHNAAFTEAGTAALTARTREEAAAASKDWLGNDITLNEVEGTGLVFRGARVADVPSPSPAVEHHAASCQFTFDTAGGEHVSMFVQVDRRAQAQLADLEQRRAYTIPAPASLGSGAPDIIVFKRGGPIYYFVAATQSALDPILRAYSVPAPSGRLPY
ncbi:MAG: hypothetical protein IT437_07125 [Phycisphaerales bacterium]|nr:hypothetical protein [Phycisphaerales bacterium]